MKMVSLPVPPLNSGAYEGTSDVDGVIASESIDVNVNELTACEVATKDQGVSTSTAINRGSLDGYERNNDGVSTGVSTGRIGTVNLSVEDGVGAVEDDRVSTQVA